MNFPGMIDTESSIIIITGSLALVGVCHHLA